ncbi:hypothetical protein LSAT2_002086 [Lamellibrachia satsuma]|nr:hypothetical protein LSAT2_002086 [Lamellibrachia satsuma]
MEGKLHESNVRPAGFFAKWLAVRKFIGATVTEVLRCIYRFLASKNKVDWNESREQLCCGWNNIELFVWCSGINSSFGEKQPQDHKYHINHQNKYQ